MSLGYWNKTVVKFFYVECDAIWVCFRKQTLEVECNSADNCSEFVVSRSIRIHYIKELATVKVISDYNPLFVIEARQMNLLEKKRRKYRHISRN